MIRSKRLTSRFSVYYGAVGGNACFLLNLPPDKRGLLHEKDVREMRELGSVPRKTFSEDLAHGAQAEASETMDEAHGVSQVLNSGGELEQACPIGAHAKEQSKRGSNCFCRKNRPLTVWC